MLLGVAGVPSIRVERPRDPDDDVGCLGGGSLAQDTGTALADVVRDASESVEHGMKSPVEGGFAEIAHQRKAAEYLTDLMHGLVGRRRVASRRAGCNGSRAASLGPPSAYAGQALEVAAGMGAVLRVGRVRAPDIGRRKGTGRS